MMDELHWYALNYRTAVTQEETENAWKDLVTYIKERIAGEREACAEVCEDLYANLNDDLDCRKRWPEQKRRNEIYAAAIRARGQE
jgi:hypothetical protein